MDKPRIFLGSSTKQAKLLDALTRGLEDVCHVEPWTTSFNPGTTTLERLLELTREVDFAAFVFAQDDWTTASPPASPAAGSGQAAPRDNVVFEAGLFGGALGMRRTFILHASGSKLPTDLLGLTCIRYAETILYELRGPGKGGPAQSVHAMTGAAAAIGCSAFTSSSSSSRRKARMSRFTISGWVWQQPCGRSVYVTSLPFFRSLTVSGPESA